MTQDVRPLARDRWLWHRSHPAIGTVAGVSPTKAEAERDRAEAWEELRAFLDELARLGLCGVAVVLYVLAAYLAVP